MNRAWLKTVVLLIIVLGFITSVAVYQHITQSEVTPQPELTENERQENDVTEEEDQKKEKIDDSNVRDAVPTLGEYEPNEVLPGSNGTYEITYTMGESDTFHIASNIEVENLSNEAWSQIGFYVVPNALTEEYAPFLGESAIEFTMEDVLLNNEETSFTLENNTLMVDLSEPLKPTEKTTVSISYEIVVPGDGVRLRKLPGNYNLVYSYPMLGTYQDGWNIEPFNPQGESYHTGYGDFTVHYELPSDYYVVTSATDGEPNPHRTGTVEGENIKDFYIGFVDPELWVSETTKVGDTAIRAFAPADSAELLPDNVTYMEDALTFFNENVGPYVKEELDVLLNNGGMEYPSVIEVYDPNAPPKLSESVIAHEIAHQWFYFMITSDPYKEAWVDEGITEFATSLYLYDKYEDDELALYNPTGLAAFTNERLAVNQTLDQLGDLYPAGAYGIPAMQLWDYFESNGSINDAHDFLAAYFDTYAFKQVTSEEFVRFFEVYHGQHEHEFFDEWMDINWEQLYQ